MTFQLSWYEKPNIVQGSVTGDLSLDELYRLSDEFSKAYLTESHNKVHFIVDLRKMQDFPKQLLQLRDAVSFMRHPKMGQFIIVSDANPAIYYLGKTVSQLVGVKFQMVSTFEQGLQFTQLIEARNLNFLQS